LHLLTTAYVQIFSRRRRRLFVETDCQGRGLRPFICCL